jgi:serine/threonine-protein kinase
MVRDSLVGKVLAQRFKLLRSLGRGGMGEVYLGQHVRLARRYAIKVLPAGMIDATTLGRFENEAEAASRLHHPNVAAVVEHGVTETGTPFLVMELAEGEPLGAILDRRGALPALEALELLRQIALGLEHAHACGLVHRDLKPDNVMVDRDGRARILDFGLAVIPELGDAGRFTARGVVMGSPAFMAPEQVAAGAIDGRTDLFALGVIAFLMATGEMPYTGRDAAAIAGHNLSTPTPRFADRSPRGKDAPDLEALCRHLMEKQPHERPANAAAVIAALDAAIARRRPAAPAQRPRRFAWFGAL